MTRTAHCISFILQAAALLFFAACAKAPVPDADGSIGFSASSTAVKSIGSTETDNDNLTGNSIGVYGYYSPEFGGNAVTNVFETSDPIKLSYTRDGWQYSPLAYWHRSQYYRFRAFHPYDAHVVTGSDADDLIITYQPGVDDYDLLVAFAERHPSTQGTDNVHLKFRHALSALSFRIAFDPSDAGQEQGHNDVINEFWLTGLYAAGTMYYTDTTNANGEGEISWDTAGYEGSNPFYHWTGSKNFRITDEDRNGMCTIFDGDGIVFAIPQTCSDPAAGFTRINFITGNAPDVVQSFELPLLEWVSGKKYTYDILITLSTVNVTVSIADWTDREAQLDIFA